MRSFERRSLVRIAAQRVMSDGLQLQNVSGSLGFEEGRYPHLTSGLTAHKLISIRRPTHVSPLGVHELVQPQSQPQPQSQTPTT
jgi:hypothetical protein